MKADRKHIFVNDNSNGEEEGWQLIPLRYMKAAAIACTVLFCAAASGSLAYAVVAGEAFGLVTACQYVLMSYLCYRIVKVASKRIKGRQGGSDNNDGNSGGGSGTIRHNKVDGNAMNGNVVMCVDGDGDREESFFSKMTDCINAKDTENSFAVEVCNIANHIVSKIDSIVGHASEKLFGGGGAFCQDGGGAFCQGGGAF